MDSVYIDRYVTELFFFIKNKEMHVVYENQYQ